MKYKYKYHNNEKYAKKHGEQQQKNNCASMLVSSSKASYKPPLREHRIYIAALAHTPKKMDSHLN